jgi:hypothetical protein
MYSLAIAQHQKGAFGVIEFSATKQAQYSIEFVADAGINVSFEACPSSIAFLNISFASNLDWDCTSKFASASFLAAFESSRIRFGSQKNVQLNDFSSSDDSRSFIASESLELKTLWSNVFDMQNNFEAAVASNIMNSYYDPISCYKSPLLTISLYGSSSMHLEGRSNLLFGVAAQLFGASCMTISSNTSLLHSVYLRSRMEVLSGSLYVCDYFLFYRS